MAKYLEYKQINQSINGVASLGLEAILIILL